MENKVLKDNIERLNQYVPIVAKVHGNDHPEILEVKKVFEELTSKLENKQELTIEFDKLRQITNNYLVPSDVCESYEAVYQMLEELDNAYEK